MISLILKKNEKNKSNDPILCKVGLADQLTIDYYLRSDQNKVSTPPCKRNHDHLRM